MNIGNNNNNQNSQNVIMFNPMMGRRSLFSDPKARFKRSILDDEKYCPANDDKVPVWLKKSALYAIEFYLRLKNCDRSLNQVQCRYQELSSEKKRFENSSVSNVEKEVLEHLLIGTAKIAGLDFE